MKRVLLVFTTLSCLLHFASHANTLIVTNANNSGPGSLRAQVSGANHGDVIVFDNSTNGNVISLDSEIIIQKSIQIQGNGVDNTIISCANNNGALDIVFPASNVKLEKIQFKNGKGNSLHLGQHSLVYGVVNALMDGHLEIKQCTFLDNITPNFGYGAAVSATRNTSRLYVKVIDSKFYNNQSGLGGGALFAEKANITIINSHFENNQSGLTQTTLFGGGAIATIETDLELLNCNIIGNHSGKFGGGIMVREGDLYVLNSVVANNHSDLSGGGIECHGVNTTIVNTTIAGNHAGDGGGIRSFSLNIPDANLRLINSIVAKNTATYVAGSEDVYVNRYNYQFGGDIYLDGGNLLGVPILLHTNTGILSTVYQSGINLIGSTGAPIDPLFRDLPNNNLKLAVCSPAINLGNNSLLPNDTYDIDNDGNYTEVIDIDLISNSRIRQGNVDAGALEYLGRQQLVAYVFKKYNSIGKVQEIIANVINGSGNLTYSWEAGGQIVSTSDRVVNPCQNKVYTLTITDVSCNITKTISYSFTNALNSCLTAPIGIGLRLYPNPSVDGNFHIETSLDIIQYRVYNDRGELVVSKNIDSAQSMTVNLAKQGKGMYLIQVISKDGGIEKARVLVE